MIKPNELRIGNLIHFEKPVHVALGKIVNNNTLILDSYGLHLIEQDPNTKVSPVKITEEWLFKFDFKYQDRDVNARIPRRFYISRHFGKHREYWLEMNMPDENWKMDTWFWWLHWDVGGGNSFISLPDADDLRNVHQLQNLYFALSGEELQIKMP